MTINRTGHGASASPTQSLLLSPTSDKSASFTSSEGFPEERSETSSLNGRARTYRSGRAESPSGLEGEQEAPGSAIERRCHRLVRPELPPSTILLPSCLRPVMKSQTLTYRPIEGSMVGNPRTVSFSSEARAKALARYFVDHIYARSPALQAAVEKFRKSDQRLEDLVILRDAWRKALEEGYKSSDPKIYDETLFGPMLKIPLLNWGNAEVVKWVMELLDLEITKKVFEREGESRVCSCNCYHFMVSGQRLAKSPFIHLDLDGKAVRRVIEEKFRLLKQGHSAASFTFQITNKSHQPMAWVSTKKDQQPISLPLTHEDGARVLCEEIFDKIKSGEGARETWTGSIWAGMQNVAAHCSFGARATTAALTEHLAQEPKSRDPERSVNLVSQLFERQYGYDWHELPPNVRSEILKKLEVTQNSTSAVFWTQQHWEQDRELCKYVAQIVADEEDAALKVQAPQPRVLEASESLQ